jgi:hypothetical protein
MYRRAICKHVLAVHLHRLDSRVRAALRALTTTRDGPMTMRTDYARVTPEALNRKGSRARGDSRMTQG